MKYKLLKDLPGIKAGTVFHYNKGDTFLFELVNGTTVGGLLDFIKGFGIDNDFFEPIAEKKRFEDLKEGDECFYITNDGIVRDTVKFIPTGKSQTFLTREDAEMEALRREARANQEWIPNDCQAFYEVRAGGFITSDFWSSHSVDFAKWHMGNVHRTEEDAEKWKEKYYEAFFVKPFKK